MTNAEIIGVLSNFMLYNWAKDDGSSADNPRRYLESRDALQPVLSKLSDGQWFKLHEGFQIPWLESYSKHRQTFTQYLLTMPPRVLAEAVAMVVKEGR